MRPSALILVALVALACVSFASARALPSALKSLQPAATVSVLNAKATVDSNSNGGNSAAAVTHAAVKNMNAAGTGVAILAEGVWLHDRVLVEGAAAAKATAQNGHAPDDGRHGLSTQGAPTAHYATLRLDNNWDKSESYCNSVGGTLCTFSQICPKGKGHGPIGESEIPVNRRSWSPIKDGNLRWVNLAPGPYAGRSERCAAVSAQDWGTSHDTLATFNSDYANHSKSLVPCCNANGVMKSRLRSKAKYPGVNHEDEDEGPIIAIPKYKIPVAVLGASHVGPWGNVNAPLRGQAEWIWNDPKAITGVPAQGARPLEFQKTYHSSSAQTAKLVYVIDDHGSVLLNGKQVASASGGWGANGKPHTVQLQLRKGKNIIEFRNKNGGGPAGFIAAAFDSRGTKLFQTDRTWFASRRGP